MRWESAPNLNGVSSLGWDAGTPSSTNSVNAVWASSTTANLTGQSIQFYSDASCTSAYGSAALSAATRSQALPPGAPDGTYAFRITSNSLNAGSSVSSCSPSMVIDTLDPVLTITSPITGASITAANAGAFTVAGSCSEESRTVSISDGTSSDSVPCSGGSYSKMVNFSLSAEGARVIMVTHVDLAGNSASASVSVTKDTQAPTLAFSSPAANSHVNAASASSFTVSGTCSENTRTVVLSGAASGSVNCSGEAWSFSLDLALLPQGPFSLSVDHSDQAGNAAPQAMRSFIKDTVAPTVAITSPAAASYVTSGNAGAFTLSGTCSESGRTVSIGGAVATSATCSVGNTWSLTLDLSSLTDGPVSFTADHTDAAGNAATQASRSFTKDTGLPTVAFRSPAANSSINSSSVASFAVTGACSENGRSVLISGGASATVSCTAGGWSANLDFTSADQGSVTIQVNHSDAAGNNATQITRSFQKDSDPPSVAITAPTGSTPINSGNMASFTVSGTCTENGRNVHLSGGTSTTVACSGGYWSATLDLSSAPDGAVTIDADHTDAAGNPATQDSRSFTKTSAPGGSDSITIAGGASFTNSTTVTLTLNSDNYTTEMYVTNIAGCTSGGSWEPYATSRSWTLGQTNAAATVYVQYKDGVGNLSGCLSDTITHDSIAPTVAISTPAANSYVNADDVSSYTVTGSCSEDGRNVVISGSASATVSCGSGVWSADLDFTSALQGSVVINVNHDDAAGNAAIQASRTFIKDTVLPTIAITTPSSGAYITSSNVTSFTVSGTCSEGSLMVSISDGTTNDFVACSSGNYTKSVDFTNSAEGPGTLTVTHTDVAGNSQSATVNVTKDTTAPTLAISTPAANSYVNSSNVSSFTVTGTCSENGRNVVISGAASATVTCTTPNWSANLDFTSAAQGSVTINVNHSDSAGNPATQASLTLIKDIAPPTLTISNPSAPNVTAITGSVTYIVTSSGSNSVNLTPASVTLSATGGATCSKTVTNGTTTTATVTLYGCSGVAGSVAINIAAGVAQDAAGNSSAFTGPSPPVNVISGPFTYNWAFNATDTASYSYNTTLMDFTGGVVKLTGTDQVDNDNTSSGFGGGTLVGASWDATNDYLRLSTTTNTAELDSSWTPRWADLKFYWRMNGTGAVSGTTFPADAPPGSCRRSVGTNANYDSAGKLNDALQIASDSKVECTNSGAENISSTLSIGGWIKHTDGTAVSGAPLFSAFNGLLGWNIQRSGSTANLSIRMNGSTSINNCGSTTMPALDGNWHHVLYTVSLTNTKVYLDGVLKQSCDYPSATSFASATAPYIQGLTADGTTLIDEWAIWDTILLEEDAGAIYSRQSAKYSGMFTSRVMDALATGQSWTKLSWVPTLPFLKQLPDYAAGPVQNETASDYSALVGSTGSTGDNDLMTGLVGLWHLNQAAGTTAAKSVIDSSGQGHHGTPANSPVFGGAAPFGTGVRFNGTGSKFTVADTAALRQRSMKSVSMWLKKLGDFSGGDPTYPAYIFRKGETYGTNSLSLHVFDGSPTNVYFGIGQPGTGIAVRVTAGLSDHEWTHIVGVIRGGPVIYTLEIWKNGVLADSVSTGELPADSNEVVHFGSRADKHYNGMMDEAAIWNRPLHPNEIVQLYRRGANRLKHQVRVCTTSNCGEDPTGANWKGPSGTNQTYFSELNNNTAPLAMTGTTKKELPSMRFTDFTSPVGTSRYFQYRTILESDDTSESCDYGSGSTWCSPELKSVTVDPVHYSSGANSIYGHFGADFSSLNNFVEDLRTSCPSGIGYNLSLDKLTWYWWNSTKASNCTSAGSGAWCPADGTVTKSNPATTIATQTANFGTQIGTGTVYFKAFLKSSGSTPCELDNVSVSGMQ